MCRLRPGRLAPMARKRGPIGHEDQLPLVDHLEELRRRIIWCVAAFVVAFAVCFWQTDAIMDVVNKPLAESQRNEPGKPSPDPLQQNAYFDRQLADAIEETVPGLESLAAALNRLADGKSLSAEERAALRASAEELERSAGGLEKAAAAVPQSADRRPVTLGVAEPFMTTISIASYAAILLVLPILLYHLYAFVLPAFTPRERQVALPLLLTVPFLFLLGVAFAYFIVLPGAVDFLQNFNAENFDILVQARPYFKFAVFMMAGIGLLFQIPIVVLAVTRLGIVTTAQMRENRPYYVLGVAIVAAIGNGSPDPFTMIFVMIPLILLFEISLRLASWLEKREAASAESGGDGQGGEA
jgi:sec-independent protein translocase protein TatC